MVSVCVMKKRIDSLTVHPAQASIYSIEPEAVESLAENIKRLGQLEPAIVAKDGTLLSGYTRCAALKLLGLKTIECRVVDVPAEEHVFYLISCNKQRVKSYVCRVAEIEALKKYYSKGRGYRSDLLEPEEGHTCGGRRLSTRQRIAADLGVSQDTISKLSFINKHRPDLLSYIGQSITLTSCHAQIRLWLNQAKILKENKRSRRRAQYKGKSFSIFIKSAEVMDEVPDDSVNAIITSPPYYQMRVFTAGGASRSAGNGRIELGQEPDVGSYVENLSTILAECARVLNPTGSFYLNIGDTMREGQLLNVPHRVAIHVQDKLGLILKQTLIWWKSGSILPESTKRRRMNDYEFVFHFVKDRKKYYYDADSIREPYDTAEPVDRKAPRHYDEMSEGVNWRWVNIAAKGDVQMLRTSSNVGSSIRHAAGKIPGAVLDISRHCPNMEQYGIAHSAGFPPKLVTELLKPVIQPDQVVLDPFSGSATTGVVVLEFGCSYIGYEINSQFAELGMKRLKDATKKATQSK